jgi:hypothetical protein
MPLSRAKQLWIAGQRRMRDGYADTRDDIHRSLRYWQFAGLLVALYLLVAVALGIYWSRTPAQFDVRANADEALAGAPPVAGAVLTAALIKVGETLLDKPGGYLANDIMPPGVWLDNMPSWEYGVLQQARDLSQSLRENFHRAVPGSVEDKNLTLAQSRFHFNHRSWIMPSSEGQYREGVEFTRAYLRRLQAAERGSQFAARADTLDHWLGQVGERLDYLAHRLSASVGPVRVQDAGDELLLPQTPWRELDDVFFEARGSAWALLHFLRAVELDFADVLKRHGAQQTLRHMILELEQTQMPLRSPVVMNGRGFGILPNHSLVMASYIVRADSLLTDLRRQLANDGRAAAP